jgi:hypothetical protein
LPQPKDVGARVHNLSLYRDGVMRTIYRIWAVEKSGGRIPQGLARRWGLQESTDLPSEYNDIE